MKFNDIYKYCSKSKISFSEKSFYLCIKYFINDVHFPVYLQNFIKFCVFFTNVATDLKNYKQHSDLIRITQA